MKRNILITMLSSILLVSNLKAGDFLDILAPIVAVKMISDNTKKSNHEIKRHGYKRHYYKYREDIRFHKRQIRTNEDKIKLLQERIRNLTIQNDYHYKEIKYLKYKRGYRY